MNLDDVKSLKEPEFKIFDDLERNGFHDCSDILDHLENENIMDQSLMDQPFEQNHLAYSAGEIFNGEEGWMENPERPTYIEDMLEQMGKDLEGQIGREVEEHKSRIFELISGYKENVGCVFGQNISEAAEVPDMTPMQTNGLEYQDQKLDACTINKVFDSQAYDVEHAAGNGYMGNSDAEIELSIDKQLVMIVASCLKICRYLDG